MATRLWYMYCRIADDTIRVYSVPGALQWELELE